jgi:hypothetical protein
MKTSSLYAEKEQGKRFRPKKEMGRGKNKKISHLSSGAKEKKGSKGSNGGLYLFVFLSLPARIDEGIGAPVGRGEKQVLSKSKFCAREKRRKKNNFFVSTKMCGNFSQQIRISGILNPKSWRKIQGQVSCEFNPLMGRPGSSPSQDNVYDRGWR